jgi:hypothetical protein
MSDIEDKVQAAIAYVMEENLTPSISRICRLAQVSRANLYTSHPDLIDLIKSYRTHTQTQSGKASALKRDLPDEITRLKKQVRVLSYACIELKQALDAEREKNELLNSRLEKIKPAKSGQ